MNSGKFGSWAAFAAGLLVINSTVWAVHPHTWRFNTEKAYARGKFSGTQVNNYGELQLGRKAESLLKNPAFNFVNALVQSRDGSIYFGTSSSGKVFKYDHGKAVVYYAPPGTENQVMSLAIDVRGNILAGISGHGAAKLVQLSSKVAGKVVAKTIFSHPGIKYIWAIDPQPDGTVYLATGPHGELWKIVQGGKAVLALKTGTTNILTIANMPGGNLAISTDKPGLVIRMNQGTGKSFVLLSAGHAEIDSLVVDKTGDIFAATASPLLARLGSESLDLSLSPVGRPARVNDAITGAMKNGAAQGKGAARAAKAPDKGKMGHLPRPQPMNVGLRPLPFPSEGNVKSNVVYEITPDGRSSVLLHVPDMILVMLYHHGKLLLGLGGHGRLLEYDPLSQTETLVTRLKELDIQCMLAGKNGDLYLGTANRGDLLRVSSRVARSGTYTSRVLDARLPANWGVGRLKAGIPAGASVSMRTRSGNVKDVQTLSRFWSPWSAPIPANTWRKISSPIGRFLQFRIFLTAGKNGASPVVHDGRVVYEQINVPPQINSVTALPVAGNPHEVKIRWHATDANGDELTYRLEYRAQSIPVWIHIAKDLRDSDYVWDTSSVPDGEYRVKLVADDAESNTPQAARSVARETRYFVVENTPPTITGLKYKLLAGGQIRVNGFAHGALSPIVAVAFQVDSAKNWQPAAASDSIFDSPLEGFSAQTGKLTAGPHRIAIRAVDAKGNKAYKSVLVTIH